MQRVVILGGGVGGTLTANLVARKLKARIAKGEAKVTVVDATGQARRTSPGYMYIAMGHERAGEARPPRAVAARRQRRPRGGPVAEDRRRGARASSSPPARRSTTTSS